MIWHELTRPRGDSAHRFYRGGRSSRSGIALLIVITTLMLLTIIVGEMTYGASVRFKLAAHSRDEAKAEVLAYSGMQFYHLILVASKQLGNMGSQLAGFGIDPAAMGLNGDTLWQLVPFINTGMMRMLLVSGGDPDDEERADFEENGLTEDQVAETRKESGSDKNFLDFDGDFFAEVVDEDRKIKVTNMKSGSLEELKSDAVAIQLYNLMSGRHNCKAALGLGQGEVDDHDQFFYDKNINRWELIGNLADWLDVDSTRVWQGGQEEGLYANLPHPYLPKNGAVDSMDELRLIEGWHDDDIWERYGDKLTVYGGGKVNINTADCEVIWSLLQAYVSPSNPEFLTGLLQAMETEKALMGGTYGSARSFTQLIERSGGTVDPQLSRRIDTKGNVFRIQSTGTVNDASVSIDTVIDFSKNKLGKVVYFKIR